MVILPSPLFITTVFFFLLSSFYFTHYHSIFPLTYQHCFFFLLSSFHFTIVSVYHCSSFSVVYCTWHMTQVYLLFLSRSDCDRTSHKLLNAVSKYQDMHSTTELWWLLQAPPSISGPRRLLNELTDHDIVVQRRSAFPQQSVSPSVSYAGASSGGSEWHCTHFQHRTEPAVEY